MNQNMDHIIIKQIKEYFADVETFNDILHKISLKNQPKTDCSRPKPNKSPSATQLTRSQLPPNLTNELIAERSKRQAPA